MSDDHFPDGKLNEEDEGEVGIAIGIKDGRVIVMFPKPVAWFGLPGEQSIEMGRTLIKRGREALAMAKD
jgi:hypothetical protein